MLRFTNKTLSFSIAYLVGVLLLCSVGSATAESQPIPASEAFVFQAQIIDKKKLEFYWQIAAGHHLYQDQLKILNSNNVELLNDKNLPKGHVVDDPVLGESVEYENKLLISLPLDNKITSELLVHYQGCSADGFCYEPIVKLIRLEGFKKPIVEETSLQEFPTAEKTNVDNLALEIKEAFLPLTLVIFFGLGFLLSFSPCVLPMIPLVVNLIVGTEKMSPRKSAMLAGTYVLGMASTYAIAGTLVGMLGAKLQAWFQQPIVLILFSIVLILLALSQLELIRIKVPSFNRKLHHWGQKQLQGSLPGAFILGVISSLIVSPCVTPPLIGVLTYIGQNGNPFIGGLTLFSLGLGMGVPLIIVAMLSSVILPKAGRWMNLIKIGTAVALLAMAIWILQRIIDQNFTLILWAGLCIIFAIYLRKGDKLLKTIATILAFVAIVFIAIAVMKHYGMCHSDSKVKQANLPWRQIQSVEDLQKYLKIAQEKHQFTMVDVSASWCTSCRKIEMSVFTDAKVQSALKHLLLLKIDVSNVSESENALLNSLDIYGPPAILFFDPNGKEVESKRLVGAVSSQDILKAVEF